MNKVNRRDFLTSSMLAAAGALGTCPKPAKADGAVKLPAPRPNIIYIHSHDTGRYVQPFGYQVHTPNLQRLAEQGILFRQTFTAAPTCSPSRASFLTGQCPHSNGMLGLAHMGFRLNDYRQHLLYTLRKVGYTSTLIGVQHIIKEAQIEDIGYDKVVRWEGECCPRMERVAPAAVEFLQGLPKRPFFLDVGFFDTHRPFRTPGPEDDPRYTLPPPPVPDAPATRQDMAAFNATARKLDEGMGMVLDALEANALAEDTLVIATTDHGIAFPRMKCNLTDGGMGVMMIIRGPGGFLGGKVCEAMISNIDVFPTICDLLEIERPAWLQGKSFLPVIRGETAEVNEEIFGEVTFHAAYEPMRAVRTRRWKYIRRFGDRTKPVLVNCDGGPSRDLWLHNGWGNRSVAREELYDLIFDPNEKENRVGDAACADTLAEMRERLDRWMRATNDPLLRGPVKLPSGAQVWSPDAVSVSEPMLPPAT